MPNSIRGRWAEKTQNVAVVFPVQQINSFVVTPNHQLHRSHESRALLAFRGPVNWIVEPTLRVVSTAPWMVIRWLAREARPNQRLQRTSAAQTSVAPRPPLIRGPLGLKTLALRMVTL